MSSYTKLHCCYSGMNGTTSSPGLLSLLFVRFKCREKKPWGRGCEREAMGASKEIAQPIGSYYQFFIRPMHVNKEIQDTQFSKSRSQGFFSLCLYRKGRGEGKWQEAFFLYLTCRFRCRGEKKPWDEVAVWSDYVSQNFSTSKIIQSQIFVLMLLISKVVPFEGIILTQNIIP